MKDLSIQQIGHNLELRFTLPQLATDGRRLSKPLEIEVFRGATQPGEAAPAALALALWFDLRPDQWQPHRQGERLVYLAALSEKEFNELQGTTLTLEVRTLTRGFRHRPLESDPSNKISLPLLDVPRPVMNLVAVTAEKAIELRWTPPLQTLNGKPLGALAGYRIYRSVTGKPESYSFLVESPGPPFLDTNIESERTYYYRVRAVLRARGVEGDSGDSEVAQVTAHDIFPPAPPKGLTAVYSPGAVELLWTANDEPDLAGYYVYRREGQSPPSRITKELLRTPLLRDATVLPGRAYAYQVTAVDLSGNESAPSQPAEVETR